MKILRKLKIKWVLVATLVVIIALPLTAHAQDVSVTGQMSGAFSEILQSFANFLAIILKLLQRILWPIFLAIGGLLGNDILFGYGMEQRLLEVWVQIRNFVNIIFVVALLGVALFNVLALKPDSEFALKTFLPKFAIALIAVNFSYIGMKIILDVSNVMTYAIFALPSSISEQVATPNFMRTPDDAASKTTIEKICTAYYGNKAEWDKLNVEIDKITDATQRENARKELLCTYNNQYLLSDSGKNFFTKYNSKNVALIMAIQFMNVTKVDTVNTQLVKDGANFQNANMDIAGLSFQLLFSVMLYIVYGAAYLAIFVVLLTRLVALWLFIALSPLVVLKFILPQGIMPESGGDIGQKFFKNTFAPALMGVPLTIGYIILDAFKGGFDVKGQPMSLNVIKVDSAAISDLQSMIIAFAAVAVVWVGVFAAARGTFAEMATDFIKEKVKGLGTKALEGLKMIPIIPAGPGGKGLSFYQANALRSKPWEDLKRKYGAESMAGGAEVNVQAINNLKKESATAEQAKREMQNVFANPSNAQGQKALYGALEHWKTRGTYAQKGFAAEAIRKMQGEGVDYKKLATGGLTAEEARRASRIPYLQPNEAPVAPRTAAGATTTGGAAAGAAAAGGQKPATGGAANMGNIGDAEQLGIVSDNLVKQRDEWRSGDSKKQGEIEATVAKDAEMGTVNKALGAKQEIGAVKSTVDRGEIAADTKGGDKVKGLSGDLDKAFKAMKAKGVGDDDAKKMLGRVLKTKFGADTKKFVDANADVGKYVTVE